MPEVSVYPFNPACLHHFERAARWNQGAQGAFKRVMIVRHDDFQPNLTLSDQQTSMLIC